MLGVRRAFVVVMRMVAVVKFEWMTTCFLGVDTCITTGKSDSTLQTIVHTKYQDITQKPKIICEVLQAYL
jgi:hypothetical protein